MAKRTSGVFSKSVANHYVFHSLFTLHSRPVQSNFVLILKKTYSGECIGSTRFVSIFFFKNDLIIFTLQFFASLEVSIRIVIEVFISFVLSFFF